MHVDLDIIDARSGGIGPADFVFVFGTAHPTPAAIAADIFHQGLAPFVVLTGGENRGRPGFVESTRHHELMIDAGVPADAIVAEGESRNTRENVTMSMDLIERRTRRPGAAIAVVKWYHRRGLVTLASQIRSLERIYAVAYEPSFGDGQGAVTRENWSRTAPESIEREARYMHQLRTDGIDVLERSARGWIRSAGTPPV